MPGSAVLFSKMPDKWLEESQTQLLFPSPFSSVLRYSFHSSSLPWTWAADWSTQSGLWCHQSTSRPQQWRLSSRFSRKGSFRSAYRLLQNEDGRRVYLWAEQYWHLCRRESSPCFQKVLGSSRVSTGLVAAVVECSKETGVWEDIRGSQWVEWYQLCRGEERYHGALQEQFHADDVASSRWEDIWERFYVKCAVGSPFWGGLWVGCCGWRGKNQSLFCIERLHADPPFYHLLSFGYHTIITVLLYKLPVDLRSTWSCSITQRDYSKTNEFGKNSPQHIE